MDAGEQNTITSYGVASSYKESKNNLATKSENVKTICTVLDIRIYCILRLWSEWVLSKFNGTSTPKGSYRAKTGDNDLSCVWSLVPAINYYEY